MRLLSNIFIVFLLALTASLQAIQPINSFPIPNKIQFAGQTILLERYDMRERFDREQTIIAYQHATSIMLLKRANKYFPIIEPILKRNGVPEDFKYLAVIESSLEVRAVSPVSAAGLWQLMPKTAEQFGLEVNEEVDERYHIEKSTEAACKYLKSAFAKYKSWTSAAISYNAGMGRISGELEKQKVNDALDAYINMESSRYMFRILAMKQFIENPQRFGYHVDKEHFYHNIGTQTVIVKDSVGDWTNWAAQYGISYAQLKDFNAWLRERKLTNTTKKQYEIIIPNKNDLNFKNSLIKIHSSLINDNLY